MGEEREFCESLRRRDRCARRGIKDVEGAGLGRSRDVDVEGEVGIHIGECAKNTEEGALLEVDGVKRNVVEQTTGDTQWGEVLIEAKPAVLGEVES